MPSEPDQTKIEDLLKSYAKKRAEDAGSAAELHPATRRLLQGEVAKLRRGAKGVEGRSWMQSIVMFWPRLAAVSAILVMLVTGVWLLLPGSRTPETMLAKNYDLPQSKPVMDEKDAQFFEHKMPAPAFTAPTPARVADSPPAPTLAPVKRELSAGTSVRLQNEMRLEEQETQLRLRSVQVVPGTSSGARGSEVARTEAERLDRVAAGPESVETSKRQYLAAADAPSAPKPTDGTTALGMKLNGNAPASASKDSYRVGGSLQKELAPAAPVPVLTPAPAPSAPVADPLAATSKPGNVSLADASARKDVSGVVSATAAPTVANPVPAERGEMLVMRRLNLQSTAGSDGAASGSTERFAFQNTEQKLKAERAATSGSLLVDFQFQRQDKTVRVIDGDGSIYTGQVLDSAPLGGTPASAGAFTRERITPSVQATAGRGTPFRVSGVHRTTKQTVVFEGTLLADAELESGAPSTLAKSISPAPSRRGPTNRMAGAPASSLATNASASRRVVGTLRLNGTNVFPIQAVPVIR